MRVLLVTNLWPREPHYSTCGVFVKEQVDTIRKLMPSIAFDLLLIKGQERKVNYLLAPFRVWRATRSVCYDLVHAHFGLAGVAARLHGLAPLLVTLHGSDVTTRTLKAAISKWVARRWADGVIVTNAQMKELLGRHDAQVIPCGVDLEMFRPLDRAQSRAELGLPHDRRLVLFPGDPARALKRYDLFAAAVRLVQECDPLVEPIVLFKPGRTREAVPRVMNACDVLVLTSDFEGSPMVVKEAMACNLPIVSVPVGDVAGRLAGLDGCYLDIDVIIVNKLGEPGNGVFLFQFTECCRRSTPSLGIEVGQFL